MRQATKASSVNDRWCESKKPSISVSRVDHRNSVVSDALRKRVDQSIEGWVWLYNSK